MNENNAYDPQDRLVVYGDYRYEYTAAGALSQKKDDNHTPFDPSDDTVTDYRYDQGGNLLEVNLPNGKDIEYTYDALNRLIAKTKKDGSSAEGYGPQADAVEYRLLYAGQLTPVAKVDADGTILEQYVYGLGVNSPDYIVKGDRKYRLVKDHLGSVRLVVDTHVSTGVYIYGIVGVKIYGWTPM